MKMRNFETHNIDHVTRITTFLMFVLLFAVGLAAEPALAEEMASSTDDITQNTINITQTTTTTDQTTTSTEQIIAEEITTTTTTATATTTTISINHVIINYLNEEIFNNDVSATSTWFYDSSGALYSTSTISALGVLAEASRQGEFPLTIQGGWGYYVSDVGNHPAQGFDGWIYNINQQDPGWVGMNDYLIQDSDLLTVFYSLWPWKIESSTSSIYLGEPVNFTALNYASSTWQASPSTTISINNELFTTGDAGQYLYTPTATGTLTAFIFGSDAWPQNSPAINVEVLAQVSTSTPAVEASGLTAGQASSTISTDSTSQASQSNTATQIQSIPSTDITAAANKILDYLKSQQDVTGKIIDGGISDWAIMSFASAGTYSDEIKNSGESLLNYALNYNFTDSSDLNLCAAYPRHILALMAGGIDKTDAKIIELKNKIKNQCLTGANYGQNGINDDIFGLFALLATDEPIDATSTQTIINSIKSDQTSDGAFTWAGWAGADITGGAVNALKYAETKGAGIEQEIYSKAKNYLKTNQLNDGGWGFGVSDALTTGWAMMGINALGETQNQWQTTSGANPWHVLVNQLKEGGYYESAWVPGTTDWFATKHAVPALLSKSWPIVLPAKQQNTEHNEQNTNATGTSNNSQTTETPTSTTPTVATPTSTVELVVIENATSTVATTTLDTTQNTRLPELEAQSAAADGQASNTIQTIDKTQNTINKTQTTENKKPAVATINTESKPQQFNNLIIDQPESPNTQQSPQTISPTPANAVPVNKTAKNVFTASASLAGTLGLYLAWRFIQTLV